MELTYEQLDELEYSIRELCDEHPKLTAKIDALFDEIRKNRAALKILKEIINTDNERM